MSRPTRVLIDLFYCQAALSGIRTYTTELVLGARLHGSAAIDYRFSHSLEERLQQQRYLNPDSRWRRWWFHALYWWWKQVGLPLQLIKHRPDVLICPDFVAPRFGKPRTLVVIHDALFWQYPQHYKKHWRRYFTRLVHWGIGRQTTLVTTSNHAAGKLRHYLPTDRPIAVVYQSFLRASNAGAPVLDKWGLSAQGYLLHVGSFDPRKDLFTLVRAFRRLKEASENPGLKLVLAGETTVHGHRVVYDEICDYLQRHGLSGEVIMPGYLSKAAITTLYQQARLYVFPSLEEGFGIPLLEAFSAGVPVLASDTGALREIGADAAQYVKAGDPEALSDALRLLLADEEAQKSLVKRGRQRLNFFSRKQFIQDFEKLILSPVNQPPQSIQDVRNS